MPPNALQDYMRSLTVPVVIITPVENPSTGNDRRFHALWQLLLSKHLVSVCRRLNDTNWEADCATYSRLPPFTHSLLACRLRDVVLSYLRAPQ